MRETEVLAALLHELMGPISAAVCDLDRLHANFGRLIRQRRVLDVVCAELAGRRELLPPLRRRTIAKALAALAPRGAAVGSSLPEQLAVKAARGALDAVLQNLVNNARHHAPGAAVTVRARELAVDEVPWPAGSPVKMKGRLVLIEVADSGPGVAERLRPSLFSFGAKATPERGGWGVGLWLSRLIVRAHGGELWLADTSRGAVFAAVWKLAPPKKILAAPDPSQPMRAAPAGSDGWPTLPKEFGKAVRQAREAALLTRQMFADQAGFADSTLRNVETGRHRHTASTRRKIIEQLARLGIAPLSTSAS